MGNAILIIPLILAEDECLLASKSRCGEKKAVGSGIQEKNCLVGWATGTAELFVFGLTNR